ncbi:hypothetical protein IGL98_000011 [Enterococcus sp. DIV0840]|uniref:HlyD family efflux transporter periplasmic adaptor subunit n=1 Tax=Enterococcus TaxID=1350 RepID=UPI001A8D0889|nr:MULTISPECIES: HlyD family efflux transporter periplasmic adaptor subunit [Enterococcus]MBO0434299.1 HlyD family efflux transporter periplasmic adaptor subunit [Enterococcus sp. DIV0849a]MBO0474096.1 HlyD family efflux transporter periplasmic adaptor subunit [Enterococcus ureasiticus]
MNELLNIKIGKDLLDTNYSKTGLYVLYPFILLLIFGTIFLTFGTMELSIKSTGAILSKDLGITISSPVNTKISKILVSNNDGVEKGRDLIIFDSSQIQQEVDKTAEAIKEKTEQQNYLSLFKDSINEENNKLENDLFGYKSQVENYLTALKKNNVDDSQIKKSSLSEQQNLLTTQLSSIETKLTDYATFKEYVNNDSPHSFSTDIVHVEVLSYEEKKKSLLDSKELATFKIEILTTIEKNVQMLLQEKITLNEKQLLLKESIDTTDINKQQQLLSSEETKTQLLSTIEATAAETKNSKQELTRQLESHKKELNKYRLTAEADGTIEFSEAVSKGKIIPEGTEVGKIVSHKQEKYIEVYLPSNQILGVKKGQEIKFTVNNLESNKNKVIIGTINKVQTEPKQTEQGSFYTVFCEPTDVLNYPHGTTGNINILTGKTTYLSFLWKKIFK